MNLFWDKEESLRVERIFYYLSCQQPLISPRQPYLNERRYILFYQTLIFAKTLYTYIL